MKFQMDVIRFSNTDVIATSAIVGPGPDNPIVIPEGVCAHVGTLHFFTTGKGVYSAANNSTSAPGVSYIYNAPGELVFDGSVSSITLSGDVGISAGKFYYFDGQGYTICDPQAHAR